MTPEAIYNVLVTEAAHAEWPVAYKTDLTKHDRQTLLNTDTQHFIWVLRESGTHLYPLDTNMKYSTISSCLDAVDKYNYNARYYIFFNGKLTEESYTNCKRLLLISNKYCG
jgi:hypothetical protein